jgi:uroporphyrinogen decarboxylase
VFLKACRREPTAYTPVWLMRQAGRYMKEYRDIREKVCFLELCKNKDLVTEVTVTAQERLGVDAAIIFSDILLILETLGLKLEYSKNDGPLINGFPANGETDGLSEKDPEESLSFVMGAIRQTRQRLKPFIPLIGFAGAPFTLSSYIIEGGASDNFSKTKNFMRQEPEKWKKLMAKLTRLTIKYLNAQIDAGADAVQLFDSWVGCLSAEEYETSVLAYSRHVILGLKRRVPVIHFGTRTAPFLESFARAGGDVIGVDHRMPLGDAWRRVGYDRAIQGNLDPKVLLGSLSEIKNEARKVLSQAAKRPGYIFNLGHGVLPQTPVENVIALVEMVHESSHG